MTKDRITLQDLVHEAESAFWEVVAEHYPEAVSGDLSPLTSIRFCSLAKEAISEWISANVPDQRDG